MAGKLVFGGVIISADIYILSKYILSKDLLFSVAKRFLDPNQRHQLSICSCFCSQMS